MADSNAFVGDSMSLGRRQHGSLWETAWVLVGDSMGLGGRQHGSL